MIGINKCNFKSSKIALTFVNICSMYGLYPPQNTISMGNRLNVIPFNCELESVFVG